MNYEFSLSVPIKNGREKIKCVIVYIVRLITA